MKNKVVLLESIHSVATEILTEAGLEVKALKSAPSTEELARIVEDCHILGIRSKTQLSQKVLSQAKNLYAIGAFCIGTNQIDLETSNHLGVPVFNAPYSNTRSVAELIIAELIALSRQLGDKSMAVHTGSWEKSATGSREIRGKTLGIIGYGHIGSQVSVLAEALGMRVVFYDIIRKLPLGNSRQTQLEEVLSISDFITLHVPETALTQNMIGEKELAQMKSGACLVNASRGSVVDISALANSLKRGHLFGAAVDVFPEEPLGNVIVFKNELQGLKNVILTPHIGGSTEEAQEAIGREVAAALIAFVFEGSTQGAVNFPQISLARTVGCHRLLNVHTNTPGVLRDINKIASDLGANIRAQSLSTDANIGFLLMDLEKSNAEAVVDLVAKLSTSIKTRILF